MSLPRTRSVRGLPYRPRLVVDNDVIYRRKATWDERGEAALSDELEPVVPAPAPMAAFALPAGAVVRA
jgi:hypothetical protein